MYSLLQKLKKQKELAQTQAASDPAMAQEPIEQPMPEEQVQPEMAQERQPFKLSDFMKKAGQFVSKNKDVIIPAAFSATTGMGVLPGLMAGYASRGNASKLQEQLSQDDAETQAKIAAEKEKLDWEAKQAELDRKNKIKIANISHTDDPGAKEKDKNAYINLKKQQKILADDILEANPDLDEKEALEQALKSMPQEDQVMIDDYEKRNYYMKNFKTD